MKVSSSNRYTTPRDCFEYYEMGKSREVYWKGYGAMLMAKDEEIRDRKLISITSDGRLKNITSSCARLG